MDLRCLRNKGLSITLLIVTACGAEHSKLPEIGEPGAVVEPTQSSIQTNLFARSCQFGICHDAAMQGGLDLRRNNMRANTINVPSNKSELVRIKPGDADKSFLTKKLLGDLKPSEGTPMPYGDEARLPKETIDAVIEWINNGALEN